MKANQSNKHESKALKHHQSNGIEDRQSKPIKA